MTPVLHQIPTARMVREWTLDQLVSHLGLSPVTVLMHLQRIANVLELCMDVVFGNHSSIVQVGAVPRQNFHLGIYANELWVLFDESNDVEAILDRTVLDEHGIPNHRIGL